MFDVIIILGDNMKRRIIMHIDVNNAFLSWTAVNLIMHGYPDIRKTYAIIGGDPKERKGIVLAKSPLCKQLGIKTADTIYSALRKCPNLQIYPADFNLYQKMSNSLFSLISKYTPDIEVASIDECYIDYTKVENLYGDPYEFAVKLQKEIYENLKFTVNIGIANNKLCAKMASDFEKPNKIHTLYQEEIKTKMFPLPIEDLFGIGKQTSKKLKEVGINTIEKLATTDPIILSKIFKNQGMIIYNKANGIDNEEVDSSLHRLKGIGNEITLKEDTNDEHEIFNYLFELAEFTSSRLRKEHKYAKTICVTIKTNNFVRKSHQKQLQSPTNQSTVIYEIAKSIYLEMKNEDMIRLIGIRLNQLLSEGYHQSSLFEKDEHQNNKLEETIDNLKEKYGCNIINKASLISNSNIKNKS